MRLSETALKDAKAQRMLADTELGRKTELYLKDLIPEAELQLAQVNRDLAEIAAERAGLAYEGAQLAYSFTELHAPFSGIISQPHVKHHQYLSTERRGDETLAILSNIDPVYVVVKVPYEEFIKRRLRDDFDDLEVLGQSRTGDLRFLVEELPLGDQHQGVFGG